MGFATNLHANVSYWKPSKRLRGFGEFVVTGLKPGVNEILDCSYQGGP